MSDPLVSLSARAKASPVTPRAGHPYRVTLTESIHDFGRVLGPRAMRADASARVRAIRAAVDRGAADSLTRDELADLIQVLTAVRDEQRRKWVPKDKNADWISGAFGTAGFATLVLQYRYGWPFVLLAMLGLTTTRLLSTTAKRWLDVTDELNGLVKDLRDILKTKPVTNGESELDVAETKKILQELVVPSNSDDPGPGSSEIARQHTTKAGALMSHQNKKKEKTSMSYYHAQILWKCVVVMAGAMTAISIFALFERAWPVTAIPIAIICAMTTAWANMIGRDRFDENGSKNED